jgi:EmrB/QacA subfamily drug resistance transporter
MSVAADPARGAADTTPTIDRRWLALVVIAVAQLMIALDATVVNIALPTAQHALGFGDTDRQWVITAYTVAFGGLLLLGGRIADHLGHRRAFLLGLTGFAAASALAGGATGFGMLVAGRALQGAFAAILAPTALSMVAVTFTDAKERAKAFGVYGAVASSGAAAGLLVGGAVTEYLGWRWCLYINVGIAACALVAGRAVLPVVSPFGRARLDVLGGGLITGALAAIVFGCSLATRQGWASAAVLAPIGGGMVAIALFALRQARGTSPLLPLYVLANQARAGAYLSVAATVVGSFGMFLMLTYYFQVVRHYTPLGAGLAFLPLTVAVSASAWGLASRLMPRIPARALIVPGLLVAAAGLALLAQLKVSGGYVTVVLPSELLLGLGMGCVFTPAINLATSRVERRDAGVAAAVVNIATQVGGSIGIAVVNTLAITATQAYQSSHAVSATSAVHALVHGYATATASAAALIVGVAVLALALIRTPAARAQVVAAQQQ